MQTIGSQMSGKLYPIRPYIESLIEIALLAGGQIMKIYNSNYEISEKSDSSPLTEADLIAHETIINGLIQINHAPIVSEESPLENYEIRKLWNAYWLIDPLDGTKEFIQRNGEFTVNICWVERTNQDDFVPILGVVFAPAKNRIYWNDDHFAYTAMVDESFKIIPKTRTKIKSNKNKVPFIVVGSRSHSNPELEGYYSHLKTRFNPTSFVSMGSSLKLCTVAEGEASIYPRIGPTMEWDIAAAYAIAIRSGCKCYIFDPINMDNKEIPVFFNKEDLLNPSFILEA
jgi:3'(2'), 5'-bisphosphate nucleotidase